MKNLSFYFVDVFAEEKHAGNQLAVVRNARGLSAFQMHRIANEMHFSETAFILSDESEMVDMKFASSRLRVKCPLQDTQPWAQLT